MDLLPPINPLDESPLSAVPGVSFDAPLKLVEDFWDWSIPLGGPFVSVRSARLISRLRALAAGHNALRALIESTLERIRANRAREALTLSIAMADLAVTGRMAFTHFLFTTPTESELLPAILAAPGRPADMTETEARGALSASLDRAYAVMWALRGAPSQRMAMRPALGWIAVSGEDDAPHAPVNIPCTTDPMGDITISGLSTPVTLRASIKLPSPAPVLPLPSPLRSFPTTTAWRQFDDLLHTARATSYDELILFVHGLGSRIEEGEGFKQQLINECGRRGRRVAVLSIDLPGFGYSSRLDFAAVEGGRPAHFDIGDPLGRSSFPFLTFFRNAIEKLSSRITGGIQFAIGGSLGGNLVLRLAETCEDRRYVLPGGLRRFVSWSPASIWESWERARLVPVESGTYFDYGKHEMVRRTRDDMNTAETPGSRHAWFDMIQRGPEIVPGVIPAHVAGWGAATRDFLLYLTEIYGAEWRRTFWGSSHEQLIFSHQEALCPKAESGLSAYAFKTINRPLFILSGALDDGGPERGGFTPLNYYGNVERVTRECAEVPGQRVLLGRTGHSIHDARPRWLSKHITEFLFFGNMRRMQLFALGGDGAVYAGHQWQSNGGLTPGWWEPLGGINVRQLAVAANADGRVQLLVLNGDGVTNGRYQREIYGDWNPEGWETLNGTGLRQIAAGANADGRMQLFALGGDGVAYTRYQRTVNGAWNAEWESLLGRDLRQIAVGANKDGRMQLFALGGDGVVYGRYQRILNGAWNLEGWESLGGRDLRQMAVGANADGRTQLFALGGDGVVYTRYQREVNGAWNAEWESLLGRGVRNISAGAHADGRIQLVALGGDGLAYSRYQRIPNGGWNAEGWESLGATVMSQIVIGAHADGRIQLIGLGSDRMVYGRHQQEPNGGWNAGSWVSLGGTDVRQIAIRSVPAAPGI